MEYQNPKIPEGINTSQQHPLKEFITLAAGVLGALVIFIILLGLLANKLSVYIPFKYEQVIANKFSDEIFSHIQNSPSNSTTIYLQKLADELATAQNLPATMKITVHFIDDDTINAFATLGGHIFIHNKLLKKLPNENAVAMVLGHEIAHIKNRDPIRGMSRGLIVGIALTMVNATLGNTLIERTFHNTGALTGFKFSRDQELAADKTALYSLLKVYGHVVGAEALFKVLKQESKIYIPEFLSTHPLSKKRIQYIHSFQNQNQPAVKAKITPLPDFI